MQVLFVLGFLWSVPLHCSFYLPWKMNIAYWTCECSCLTKCTNSKYRSTWLVFSLIRFFSFFLCLLLSQMCHACITVNLPKSCSLSYEILSEICMPKELARIFCLFTFILVLSTWLMFYQKYTFRSTYKWSLE